MFNLTFMHFGTGPTSLGWRFLRKSFFFLLFIMCILGAVRGSLFVYIAVTHLPLR
jgi:hypothetical protein